MKFLIASSLVLLLFLILIEAPPVWFALPMLGGLALMFMDKPKK